MASETLTLTVIARDAWDGDYKDLLFQGNGPL